MVQISDGGYALVGCTASFGAGGRDYWLVKTDSTGNMQWNRTYGGTLADLGYAVVQAADGGAHWRVTATITLTPLMLSSISG